MEKIETIEQFKALKTKAKELHGKLDTNCYLTNGGMESIMRVQNLYYAEFEQGLVLYADEGSYYRILYFLDSSQPLPDMRQDKMIEIEEPDSFGRRAKYLDAFFAKLEAAGWKRVARNVQVSSTLQDKAEQITSDYEGALQAVEVQGLHLVNCPERHADRVVELWRGWLHETDIPIEHVHFLDDPKQRVVVVLNDDDFVCATNWWRFAGKSCEIRHTVTDPAFYQRGLGYLLQCAAMKDALDNGCTSIFTYIDDTNYRSIKMFEKAGIVENGRTTVQYALA